MMSGIFFHIFFIFLRLISWRICIFFCHQPQFWVASLSTRKLFWEERQKSLFVREICDNKNWGLKSSSNFITLRILSHCWVTIESWVTYEHLFYAFWKFNGNFLQLELLLFLVMKKFVDEGARLSGFLGVRWSFEVLERDFLMVFANFLCNKGN